MKIVCIWYIVYVAYGCGCGCGCVNAYRYCVNAYRYKIKIISTLDNIPGLNCSDI